jgi:hypothetical protein
LVIPQFEQLARVSTSTHGGMATAIIVVREDVDTISGAELQAEADRVVTLVLKG